MFRCPECLGKMSFTDSERYQSCSCGYYVRRDVGRIMYHKSDTIERLAKNGPELLTHDDFTDRELAVAERLSLPKIDYRNPKMVIYLPGQERKAINVLIEHNEDLVEDLMSEGNNHIRRINGWLRDMLTEQWYWAF